MIHNHLDATANRPIASLYVAHSFRLVLCRGGLCVSPYYITVGEITNRAWLPYLGLLFGLLDSQHLRSCLGYLRCFSKSNHCIVFLSSSWQSIDCLFCTPPYPNQPDPVENNSYNFLSWVEVNVSQVALAQYAECFGDRREPLSLACTQENKAHVWCGGLRHKCAQLAARC
jgi:hypothetical protein